MGRKETPLRLRTGNGISTSSPLLNTRGKEIKVSLNLQGPYPCTILAIWPRGKRPLYVFSLKVSSPGPHRALLTPPLTGCGVGVEPFVLGRGGAERKHGADWTAIYVTNPAASRFESELHRTTSYIDCYFAHIVEPDDEVAGRLDVLGLCMISDSTTYSKYSGCLIMPQSIRTFTFPAQ